MFEENRATPGNARLFVILKKRRQTERISNGHKITQVKVIWNDNTYSERFQDNMNNKKNTKNENDFQTFYRNRIGRRDS